MIVNLTYIKPCVYSEDLDGRGILILPQTTRVREGCGSLATSSALSLPYAY